MQHKGMILAIWHSCSFHCTPSRDGIDAHASSSAPLQRTGGRPESSLHTCAGCTGSRLVHKHTTSKMHRPIFGLSFRCDPPDDVRVPASSHCRPLPLTSTQQVHMQTHTHPLYTQTCIHTWNMQLPKHNKGSVLQISTCSSWTCCCSTATMINC